MDNIQKQNKVATKCSSKQRVHVFVSAMDFVCDKCLPATFASSRNRLQQRNEADLSVRSTMGYFAVTNGVWTKDYLLVSKMENRNGSTSQGEHERKNNKAHH